MARENSPLGANTEKGSMMTKDDLEVRLIPVVNIERNSNNPSRKSSGISGLAKAMKAMGQIVPIVIASAVGTTKGYRLVAGERRWLAAQKLGWETIAAIVIGGTDSEIETIALAENTERVDPDPIAQAQRFANLAEGGLKETAKALGMTEKQVRWHRVLANLAPSLVKRYRDPETTFFEWSIEMVQRLARVAHVTQERLIENMPEDWVPCSIRDLGKALEDRSYSVDPAPWSAWEKEGGTFDKSRPHCGPCRTTTDMDMLFDVAEFALDGPKIKPRICKDVACFEAKLVRWLEVQTAEHDGLLVGVDADYWGDMEGPGGGKMCRVDEYQEVEESCVLEGVRPMFVYRGRRIGRVIWVAFKKKQEKAEAKPGAKKRGRKPAPEGETPEQARERKEAGLHAKRVGWMAQHVLSKTESGLKKGKGLAEWPLTEVVIMAVQVGVESHPDNQDGPFVVWNDRHNTRHSGENEQVRLRKRLQIGTTMALMERIRCWKGGDLGTHEDDILALSEFAGWEWESLQAEAEQAVPEPKSWARGKRAKDKSDG